MRDIVKDAVAMTSVPLEDVEDWLRQDCNCPQKEKKRRVLQSWARRTLTASIKYPEEYLLKILET
jgi:hypothetical protein